MIPINFTRDAKLNAISYPARWLFIDLLMSCGDTAKDTVTYTRGQLQVLLGSGVGAAEVLNQLEQFQLVTVVKNALIEEKEENRREGREEKEETTTCVSTLCVPVSDKIGVIDSSKDLEYSEDVKSLQSFLYEMTRGDTGVTKYAKKAFDHWGSIDEFKKWFIDLEEMYRKKNKKRIPDRYFAVAFLKHLGVKE